MSTRSNLKCLYYLDSFLLKTEDDKPVDHLKKLGNLMDYSNYPPTSSKYDKSKANALFHFKDELAGKTMKKYVGLRSKSYAYDVCQGDGTSKLTAKAKGVVRGYKATLSFKDYENCLHSIRSKSVTQFHIRSKNHQVSTEKCTKIAFSSFDSKRYLHTECARKLRD